MAFEDQVILALFIILGALVGSLYGVRRILILERKILKIEGSLLRIEKLLLKKRKK